MVSVSEALDLIHSRVPAVTTEILPLEASVGRVAAESLFARFDLPRFDNSAMDGYAVTLADAGGLVTAEATLLAGDTSEMKVGKGRALRIMTGAVIPPGADAVIPIENCVETPEGVQLPERIKKGANIRQKGEDVTRGDRLLEPGEEVGAYAVSLLASQGVTHLRLYRRPRVAVFATGHELKMHFEPIEAHQIYNSNAPMFLARAEELGCETRFLGATADTPESIKTHIASALDADLIVTSGGVSVGDADYTLQAFEELGMERLFHKVDIKPGKPTTLGRIGKTWVLNLPGNPAAAAANFEIFGRLLINRLAGRAPYLRTFAAKNAAAYRLKPGRPTVLLGRFDGEFFEILEKQGPGMVRPFKEADALLVTDGAIETIEAGRTVRVLSLRTNPVSKEAGPLFTD